MKNRLLIPLAFAALCACADNAPTDPLPRVPDLRPLLGAFPGSNGKIAFAGAGGIKTMNPDGTDVQQLTPDGAGPAWSPDGSKLAFYSMVDDHHTEIFVVNADGTGRTRLTVTTALGGPAFPAWSPDGSKIAFQNDSDRRIYVMDANGANLAALTSGPDFFPSWSPDGSKIAFATTRHGPTEIYVMNANGTGQTRLTNNLDPDNDPSWSPDGSKILFMHDDAAALGDWPDIFVMDPDGTDPVNLTNSLNIAETNAVWSPDGTKIVFVRSDDFTSEVYVMNANGTGQQNISNSPGVFESHLDWQPIPVAPVCVFGPEVYTRMQGPPARITETFSATPGSYSVDLDDLATSGADAVVTLNGVVIMEGRGTTGEVGPRHKTITVTLLASNVLEIHLRGKKGSKLQVTICPSSGSQCYPNLPAPTLSLQSTTVEGSMARFELDVANYAQFPAELFLQAPNLPACGTNTSASRTWVDIYDGNNAFLYGFCSLGNPSDLNNIWFATSDTQRPAEAYIKVTDRLCNITYTSNRITIPASQ